MSFPSLRPTLVGVIGAMALGLSLSAQADAKRDLANKVVQLQQTSVDNIARQLAGQTAQQVLQTAGQAMVNVAPDKRAAVGKEVQADVKKFYDEIEPLLRDRAGKLAPVVLVPLLEEKLTEDELKQIVAWMESPVSKKFQQVGADMQSALAQKLVAETSASVEPKLKALETSLQKKLGAASAASAPAKAPAKK